jgi:hypothetical protein
VQQSAAAGGEGVGASSSGHDSRFKWARCRCKWREGAADEWAPPDFISQQIVKVCKNSRFQKLKNKHIYRAPKNMNP